MQNGKAGDPAAVHVHIELVRKPDRRPREATGPAAMATTLGHRDDLPSPDG
jgi:hypothetical protein